ncbi:MAG: serine/threonine-protein kinase [Acidobacteriota bacterium]
MNERVEELFARYVDQRVLHDERPSIRELCKDCPEFEEELIACIREYEMLDSLLAPTAPLTKDLLKPKEEDLPEFAGFRTIEQVGKGGGGKVYKLQDRKLGRTVAAKVLRPDSQLKTTYTDFLREARAMALFEDSRIVRIYEFHPEETPPFLLMEYVDGFQLDKLGQSLEYSQRARIMAEITDAVHNAHQRGIQHRDLKPANILLDAKLCPKILDFGLSHSEGDYGHGKGTLPYMAPEQIDPDQPIDNRTDIYALGVVFYELLCGVLPYKCESTNETIDAIKEGVPKLPVEIDPTIPEPLQAIALKAMERNPNDRYASAKEMALDLHRYLSDRPVVARPSHYQSTLDQRIRPHWEQIREWLELKLIYPHEARILRRAYNRLRNREEDWIVQSRVLSFSQISLYFGAFLLLIGSILYACFYFSEDPNPTRPFLVLGIPLVGLNVLAILLFNRGKQAVAIAFLLASAVLLPLVLLILFKEAEFWMPPADTIGQFFKDGTLSNRQLQIAGFLACGWAFWLTFRTRTTALAIVTIVLAIGFYLTILTDFELSELFWDDLDIFACQLLPLLLFLILLGIATERKRQAWFAHPVFFTALGLFVLIIELLAINGELFHHLNITLLRNTLPPDMDDDKKILLDTLAAMTLNGLVIYGVGSLLKRHGTNLLKTGAQFLFIISPFAILEPICVLNETKDYDKFYNWFYLALAVTIAYLSRFRQRKSFYFAGLLNSGIALIMITDHYEWLDNENWHIVIICVSLAILALGYGLNTRERRHRRSA